MANIGRMAAKRLKQDAPNQKTLSSIGQVEVDGVRVDAVAEKDKPEVKVYVREELEDGTDWSKTARIRYSEWNVDSTLSTQKTG